MRPACSARAASPTLTLACHADAVCCAGPISAQSVLRTIVELWCRQHQSREISLMRFVKSSNTAADLSEPRRSHELRRTLYRLKRVPRARQRVAREPARATATTAATALNKSWGNQWNHYGTCFSSTEVSTCRPFRDTRLAVGPVSAIDFEQQDMESTQNASFAAALK